jgi:putative endonuclease
MQTERQRSGNLAEARARHHLEQQGMTALAANWNCRVGELDLVMRDGSTVVFVEVRYRARGDFGGALESIDRAKQRRIARTANAWLQRHGRGEPPCRFDVVAVDGAGTIEWIADAFQLD